MQLLFLSQPQKEGAIAGGSIECMHTMGNKPEIVYTDDEGALHKPSLQT